MKISNKLLLVLSSVTLLAGCTPGGEGGKPVCPQCPECTQCETCKECEECKECPECPTPHEHTFKDTWSVDENKHWKEATCDHHDITKDLGEHIDADTNGECDVCAYTFVVVPNRYTVIWENYDGKLLEVDYDVLEGSTPEYNGEDPVRTDDEDIFIFSGWSPEVTKVTGNTRYVAQFEVNTKTYKVTWEDDAGNILKQEDVQIGHVPSFGDKDPVKELTEMVEYVFAGWDKEVTRVFENVTYKATFEVANWCVNEQEFINALKQPEKPNFSVEVKTYYEDLKSELDIGTYEVYGGLIIEHVATYGTVYLTEDGSAYYYESGMGRWMEIKGMESYQVKYHFMFPYSELDLNKVEVVCDFANEQYIIVDRGGSMLFRTYFKFKNKQLVSMRTEVEVVSTHEIIPYYDVTYTWGGCEDIEIPEEVISEAKYRLLDDDPFGAIHNVMNSFTATQVSKDGFVDKYYVVPGLGSDSIFKWEHGVTNFYWDGQYRYMETVEHDSYMKFEDHEDPVDVYLGYADEFLPDKSYTLNKETWCYEYDDTENGVTYIAKFESEQPIFVKAIDDATEEVKYTITFSDFGTTTVIIPEHDWNY